MAAPAEYHPTGDFVEFQSWEQAGYHLSNGGLVLAPSDTVPAVIGDPYNPAVIRAMDVLLGHCSTAYSLNVSSVEMAERYVDLSAADERILRLVDTPFTLVTRVWQEFWLKNLSLQLHSDGVHLGIRISHSVAEQQLVALLGHPLTTTAVRNGKFLAKTIDDAIDVLKLTMAKKGVRRDVIVIRSRRSAVPSDHSTVVQVQRDADGLTHPVVLRPGMTDEKQLHRAVSTVWGPWNIGDVT